MTAAALEEAPGAAPLNTDHANGLPSGQKRGREEEDSEVADDVTSIHHLITLPCIAALSFCFARHTSLL